MCTIKRLCVISGVMEHEVCVGLSSMLEFNPAYQTGKAILDSIGGTAAVGKKLIVNFRIFNDKVWLLI